jgi:hypothetical protein
MKRMGMNGMLSLNGIKSTYLAIHVATPKEFKKAISREINAATK